jgi:site-specific DNA recombinase
MKRKFWVERRWPAIRDQARADAKRAEGAIDLRQPGPHETGGYRRDNLRALDQRVEVDAKEVRIMGSKSALLRTLVAASSAKTAGFGVPSSVPKWRGNNIDARSRLSADNQK